MPSGTVAEIGDRWGMTNNSVLGAHGEDLAVRFLEAAGMRVLCRNWRCRYGEIDVVAHDKAVTAFVEVKTRRGLGYGSGFEAVTVQKQRRLRQLAALWLTSRGGPWVPVRFDVVSVLVDGTREPVIEHRKGAF